MVAKSINLDLSIYNWIDEEAKRAGHSVSFMVNFYLSRAREEKIKEKPQMITCHKHPEATFSSKLPKCPLCAEEETLREIEQRDGFVKLERARLLKELNEEEEKIRKLAEDINKLDPETEEQGKRDRLNQQFAMQAEKVRGIKQKLEGLI